MGFLSSKELSEQWGIGQCRIIRLAREGRIPGAKRCGRTWVFPENASKPADARTIEGRAAAEATRGQELSQPAAPVVPNAAEAEVACAPNADAKAPTAPDAEAEAVCTPHTAESAAPGAQEPPAFRYPAFEFRDLASFDPPLGTDELVLKAATEAFHACRYQQAGEILGSLPDRATDRYLRIAALYTGCMIDIFLCNVTRFLSRYDRLIGLLQGDFPHKAEMQEYLYLLEATLGDEGHYAKDFQVLSSYRYLEDFLPRLTNLSAISLYLSCEKPSAAEFRAHELACIYLEKSGFWPDLESVHLSLGVAYGVQGQAEKRDDHLRRALAIAQEYEMYYQVVDEYYHMHKLFKNVVSEFPDNFKARLDSLSKDTHKRIVRFMDALSKNSLSKLLLHDDYIFLHYAVQGLTNKKVASLMHMSTGSVGKRYANIYALLGVKGKAELVELYRESLAAHPFDPAESEPRP